MGYTAYMSKVTIRPAVSSDTVPFFYFCAKQFESAYILPHLGIQRDWFLIDNFMSADTTAYFAEIMQNTHDRHSFIAELNGVIVGGISMHITESGYAEVFGFYVDSSHQKKGIGSLLWSQVEKHTQGMGLSLYVFVQATAAIQFYFSKGMRFDPADPIHLFYPNWLWPHALYQYHLIRETSQST
jgi:GNAT superfamily N-acetyltransferase